MEKLISILAKRLKSKTPKLFKGIAIGASALGVVVLLLPTLPITLPATVVALIPIVSSACAGIASVSLLTTDDEEVIKETNEMLTK